MASLLLSANVNFSLFTTYSTFYTAYSSLLIGHSSTSIARFSLFIIHGADSCAWKVNIEQLLSAEDNFGIKNKHFQPKTQKHYHLWVDIFFLNLNENLFMRWISWAIYFCVNTLPFFFTRIFRGSSRNCFNDSYRNST